MMAEKFTEEKVAECKKIFERFDKNGDGKITIDELGVVLRAYGENPTESELRDILRELDSDKNGSLNFEEFLAMTIDNTKDEKREMVDAFKVFDKNGNGYISVSELRFAITHLGYKLTKEEVDEMIQDADIGGNGQIDYKVFVTMLTESYLP